MNTLVPLTNLFIATTIGDASAQYASDRADIENTIEFGQRLGYFLVTQYKITPEKGH